MRAHALVVVGQSDGAEVVTVAARARNIPVFSARFDSDRTFVNAIGGGRVLAFAGIGDPERFFATLRDAGIAVVATKSFADHHRYTRAEARALCDHAEREGLILVTTEKDLARIKDDDAAAELAALAHALPVTLAFDNEGAFKTLVLERLAAVRTTAGG
jgi:tetraacyldisaccharide 4'-kinase